MPALGSHQKVLIFQSTFVRGLRPDAECGGHPWPSISWTTYSKKREHLRFSRVDKQSFVPILFAVWNLGEQSLEEVLLRDRPRLLVRL